MLKKISNLIEYSGHRNGIYLAIVLITFTICLMVINYFALKSGNKKCK